jgi:para-aminobenzoate synthetase component I
MKPAELITFDCGPDGAPFAFEEPRRLIRADTPAEVPAALYALGAAQADGLWLAGYASYELGYVLEPCLTPLLPAERRHPLLLFGVYDTPTEPPVETNALSDLTTPEPQWSAGRYEEAFRRAADWIEAGDIYQVNLTFPLSARATVRGSSLYAALRHGQPVGHGAYVDLGVGPVILSRSPELFFRTDASGRIETSPMKGTSPRHPDPDCDAALREGLRESTKNRAENLMIVDLLRNDLSRICAVGSVRVPSLYEIRTYATVHQMVSQVTGQLLPGIGLAEILQALFPCGSITGAPKIRAMEIIRTLEPCARGVYCGAIGWAAPDGRSAFNVAIRTLNLFDGGEVVLNVGGGIVHDSTAAGEYEEALWKARFVNPI